MILQISIAHNDVDTDGMFGCSLCFTKHLPAVKTWMDVSPA